MTKYVISVNHETCIGCGACEQNCDNFKLTDRKSNPIDSEVDEIGCNQEAAEGCPVAAISVEAV